MAKLTFRRKKKSLQPTLPPPPAIEPAASTSKASAKKKPVGSRLWMRMDRLAHSELIYCDKTVIIKRVSIPARDLRILGPIFSHSSSNLGIYTIQQSEWLRVSGDGQAYVPAEEEVLTAHATSKASAKKKPVGSRLWMRMDRLAHSELIDCDKTVIIKRVSIPARDLRILGPIFSHSSSILDKEMQSATAGDWLTAPETTDGLQEELPFEFQVLEIALEVVCTYLDSSVAELERDAYPALDELAISVSTKNLERVRSLKSNLTRLLARVQKVRDEVEHLLDDNEDMAQLYLTRKWIQNHQAESFDPASNSIVPGAPHLRQLNSARSGSLVSNYLNDHDVEDLEMLLEAYFMQLDGTRNKILSVREYIDDTESYVNLQLDNQRNELIQLQLVLE
ncbi:hypothetical protein SASPL_111510 [Salvia splendens]|uniref:Magnesium transporter n=1 Tax=Salvia splendens TaxID=180675 RepID=A0A8X8Y7G1_SALSN|nr:hypothetical protein SASPL_111510 [Salvia splendens]